MQGKLPNEDIIGRVRKRVLREAHREILLAMSKVAAEYGFDLLPDHDFDSVLFGLFLGDALESQLAKRKGLHHPLQDLAKEYYGRGA